MTIVTCLSCNDDGLLTSGIPAGWTDVRAVPVDDPEDVQFWTHVGYCPDPMCQAARSREVERLAEEKAWERLRPARLTPQSN